MNFCLFALRHRFELQDIFSLTSKENTHQVAALAQFLPGLALMNWDLSGKKLAELNRAFIVTEFVSENDTSQPEVLSAYISTLSEEAWFFALQFSPYHKVHTALENLERVHSAILEASLNLNTSMAGMDSATQLLGFQNKAYAREKSKATSHLLTFASLYASYIDVCYRIRDYCGLKQSQAYSRAIKRIIGNNAGAHSFAKGLRNFILHYHLVEPEITIKYREERTVKLYLDANSLLFSGFKWDSNAQHYIRSAEKLDVVAATTSILKDIGRVIRFHRKLAERRLSKSKFAYELYTHERTRYRHLEKATYDIGAACKRPTSVLSRVLDEGIIDSTFNSTLDDDDIRNVLTILADRHGNLSKDMKMKIARDIEKLLKSRPRLPNKGAFLNGQRLV